jgi:hypothetical protein
MTLEKRQAIGEYLAGHVNDFGARMLLSHPPRYQFKIENLPHNEVLDDEFFEYFTPHGHVNLGEHIVNSRAQGWTIQ